MNTIQTELMKASLKKAQGDATHSVAPEEKGKAPCCAPAKPDSTKNAKAGGCC
jgi:hypothetical protein